MAKTAEGIVITRHGKPVAVVELLNGTGFTVAQAERFCERVSEALLEVVGECACGEHGGEA